MNKKLKILFSVALIIIIGCSALPVFAQNNEFFAESNKADTVLDVNPNMQEIKRYENTPPELKLDIKTSRQVENPMNAIIKRVNENRKHRLYQKDEFNYNQKDVEELLLSGVTLEDVYRSDEIGNKWLKNPRDLIDLKNKKKQTWDDIETDLSSNTKKLLIEMGKKHPVVEAELLGQTISDAEKLDILMFIDSNPNNNFKEITSIYKSNGRSGLKDLQKTRTHRREVNNQ